MKVRLSDWSRISSNRVRWTIRRAYGQLAFGLTADTPTACLPSGLLRPPSLGEGFPFSTKAVRSSGFSKPPGFKNNPRPRRQPPRARSRQPRYRPWPTRGSLQSRIVARLEAICERDLPPPLDAELQSERVAMRLGSPWRDAELTAHLLVRATRSNQLDHLPLAFGDRRGISQGIHGPGQ